MPSRGNALDLAAGVVLGTAFGRIVTSLMDDILVPPLGFLSGDVDFTNLFWTLGPGEYAALEAGKEAGAVTLSYGSFIQSIASVVLVAFALFLFIRGHEPSAPGEGRKSPPSRRLLRHRARCRPYALQSDSFTGRCLEGP